MHLRCTGKRQGNEAAREGGRRKYQLRRTTCHRLLAQHDEAAAAGVAKFWINARLRPASVAQKQPRQYLVTPEALRWQLRATRGWCRPQPGPLLRAASR